MAHFISSDHHFFHYNIISYSNRPFKDVNEMHEVMIERHNSVVGVSDTWYCLGDICILRGNKLNQKAFTTVLKRMNGHKRLLLGNHDHFSMKTYKEAGFEKIRGAGKWLEGEGGKLLLSHYPVHPNSMGKALANIHGHTHTAPPNPPVISTYLDDGVTPVVGEVRPYINVSVEAINYTPVSLEEIMVMIKKAKQDYESGLRPYRECGC